MSVTSLDKYGGSETYRLVNRLGVDGLVVEVVGVHVGGDVMFIDKSSGRWRSERYVP